jgi:hypothetical protein
LKIGSSIEFPLEESRAVEHLIQSDKVSKKIRENQTLDPDVEEPIKDLPFQPDQASPISADKEYQPKLQQLQAEG